MKNKKILAGAIAIITLIILIITGICLNISKSQNAIRIAYPELARAMEYEKFFPGDEAIDNTDNVKFSAFFLRDLDGDGYAEKIKGTCRPIGEEDTLYIEINVLTEGYLKDAKVEIQGQNFYLQTTLPKDEQLKDNYIGNNVKTIEFNQLNNGTQKLFTGVVRSGDYSYASTKNSAIGNNINNYSRTDNKIKLTGIYVNEKKEEIQITKEIPLTVDWYGTTNATISATNQSYHDLSSRIQETLKLNFKIDTNETAYKLNLSKNHVEGKIPELNGYAPTDVRMINPASKNITFAYNNQRRTFTINRTGAVNDDGTIKISVARSNSYEIEVIYPIEAYQSLGEDNVTLKIPVYTYYEGYNNTNEQFSNPHKSNTASATIIVNFENPKGEEANFDITVGKNVYKPTSRYIVSKHKPLKIYDGISETEKDDIYTVRWSAFTGTNGQTTGLVMKETKDGEAQIVDNFIKTDYTQYSMENVTTNVGIYFTGASKILKEDGWIKVYDEETDNLLVTFTKDNWGKYTESNPYKYELPVKHIRVETSETNASESLYVYNIKELDDEYITQNYTKDEFHNLQYIESTLNGYLGGNYVKTIKHQANYEAPYSVATISLSNSKISTQLTEEHEKITIKAQYDASINQIGWSDGSFLVKLPEEILKVEINSVEISNQNVTITSYEVIENDSQRFIKINTKNNNDVSQGFDITIDINITPDPRIASISREVELYATNENTEEYYYKAQDLYDVNNNLDMTEIVNKTTTLIDLIAPSSLLTSQIASEYDSKNTVVVSPEIADITPLYAKVDNEKQTAKVGIQVKNNYSSTISEIIVLGKIPFEGNTTVISGKNLNSQFTTKMQEYGIEIPEELQDKIAIYYSENENPDKNLNNAENAWKTGDSIGNWGKIKTFLIDFQDEKIEQGAEYEFYYKIEIPQGLEFNKISYSHHGIYFCLDTDEGKYRTQTEPNKLGFRIAEKFNLELIKTQTGKDKLIAGATYSIREALEDGTTLNEKTAVTNENGTLIIKNLYAEKTYEIQEIKSPKDYELNTDIIKIIGNVAEDGTLIIQKLQGITKEDITVTKNEGEMHKATVKVEDEVKAKLKITKKEQGTENTISSVKYKLTGYWLPESGRILTTNVNGETSISGLKINEEYTLQETKATGYYLAEPIRFKIVNNEGIYSVEVIEGTFAQSNVTEEDSLPIANLILENEKIPTYTLEISKIKKILETELEIEQGQTGAIQEQEITYLQGAKFKLYKGDKEIGQYTTDENGKITIENLYQYVEGKEEQATYILKEVLAPDGYAKVKDITFKVQNTEGTLTLININGEQEKYTVDGTTVKLIIEDSPSFKLIKKDAETGEVLANVKFAIYNVDEGIVPATNSKGEIIGTKENIKGKEYYTVTTDANGIITADLTEGLYKAVEVQAPDKYDISDSTYYFGIGASREGNKGIEAEWATSMGGSLNDNINFIFQTSDEGYIVGGSKKGGTTDLGNGIILTNKGDEDGMVVKYNSEEEVEWASLIGGNLKDIIDLVLQTSDGGYMVGGTFYSTIIDLGNGVKLTNKSARTSSSDAMLIKYNDLGEIEWTKVIGGDLTDSISNIIETKDGGYMVSVSFRSTSIDLEGGKKFTRTKLSGSGGVPEDSLVIKYSRTGNVEWAKRIGGEQASANAYVQIKDVIENIEGGYFVNGTFVKTEITLENGIKLTNKGASDGFLIKYSPNGDVEWGKTIGGDKYDYIVTMSETNDGGCIVGGDFSSATIDIGNGRILTNVGNSDGILIKYSQRGEVEWTKEIGGSDSDEINKIVKTKDGGYIVIGIFSSSTIDLGREVRLTGGGSTNAMVIKYSQSEEIEWAKAINGSNSIETVKETKDGGYIIVGSFSGKIDLGNGVELISAKSTDGILIKYSANGNVKWVKSIGGSKSIKNVEEIEDGGYIVAGTFSSTIALECGVTLTTTGSTDGMLIKYKEVEISEIVVKQAQTVGGSASDSIKTVKETKDGGYIVGGHFSSKIDLSNGVGLISAGSTDGMLIKHRQSGEVEWAKAIGGSANDYIETVKETKDGGYVVVGSFSSSIIELGNGRVLTNVGSSDGMLIKYSQSGDLEWAVAIGGSGLDYIETVEETKDGSYIVGGDFSSSTIDLRNGVTLTRDYNSTSYSDGMLIKYSSTGEAEWAKIIKISYQYHYIHKVKETKDGSYIVGGEYRSGSTLNNGMLIKYSSNGEVEWEKLIGGTKNDKIYTVEETKDGGYIVVGSFASSKIELGNGCVLTNVGSSDGMLIKYSQSGDLEWAVAIGGSGSDSIETVEETKDGGYIVGGNFNSSIISLGNGVGLSNIGEIDGMLIKYSSTGEAEWARAIGGSNSDYINTVVETKDGNYMAGGYFYSSIIDLGNGVGLTNVGKNDGMLLKISEEMGAPEVQELTIENLRKEFKITTDIKSIDGIKGGKISGEDKKAYDIVKFGDSNTKEIIMIPDENYEIIKITVNGEEYKFTANEENTYTMPTFTDITENIHIEVTYSLKDNKIIINKTDSETKEKLQGASFELNQIEEREIPESTISKLTDNGQEYIEPEIEREVIDVIGKLIDNGQGYNVRVDTTTEVTDVLGTVTNNGDYYFIEQDGKYVPTNSKTYQVANGGTAGKGNTTANSYIEIDLTNKTGDYVVIVNATVSSESYDYGYATITEGTDAPIYSDETGRYIYISGNIVSTDYTSMALVGGRKYYLHLGYRKNATTDTNEDQIIFNSIKVFPATCTRYNFIENEGKYEATNQGQASTVANSYIPIDLTNKIGQYALIVNANVSSQSNYDYGYATITETTTAPVYNSSTGQFIKISGTSSTVAIPKDYQAEFLDGGKIYYLHLGYYKNSSTNTGSDKFTVNSVKLYETKIVTYNFIENEGKYESTIQGKDNRVANSYIPIDLTNCKGTYNLIVNAKISSESGDYGYVTVTENTTRPAYNSSTGRLIYISGTSESVTTPTDYTTVIEGGKIHYLHLGYYKNSSTSSGEDKFTINNIMITPNAEDLYHTEVTTDSQGQAVTQIPFGKYAVTEKVAPEGYELNENATIIEFREDGIHEFTLENNKLAKVIVHHYIKDTTTKVAEDDLLQDKAGYPYTTVPKLDLSKYELEKGEDEKYITPENATGQFAPGEQEVIYYYVEKQIPLVVNHFIEGTEDAVPLLDGEKAETVTTIGKSGDTYTTSAIPDSELSREYELVEIPENSTGIYEGDIIEVTYYYKQIVRRVTINKYREDGITPLEGAVFTIADKNSTDETELKQYTTNSKGKIEVVLQTGEYIITEIQAPKGYQLPENPTQEIAITRETENITLDITNIKQQGNVIVHYWIENSTTPVLLEDGSPAHDVLKTGTIGKMYVTQKLENVDPRFELKEIPANASGNITEGLTEVIYYYKMPEIQEESTIEKKATDKITSKDTKVYYEIKFTSTINYLNGKAKIILIDTLPYSINVQESELDGGIYNESTRTITWEDELDNLPVIFNEMTIERTKVLNLKYNYENINETTGKMKNKVKSRIELLEQNEQNPEEYIPVKVDERETIAETLVEIPTEVKVHHYIYDTEKDEYTTIKLAEDEIINGIIGQQYTTTPSESVSANYIPVSDTPKKYEGKMTEEIIEVNYYYQLITPTVENNINKIATTNKKDENEVAIITKEDEIVTYYIKYNITIKDYIGKATVEIVDNLPAEIDTEKSELAGGTYDAETKTIKWIETLEGIDTFTNGIYLNNVTKQIKVVYKYQNVTNYLVNTVTGTTKVYYPENHSTNPGEEQLNNTAKDNEEVQQEYKVNLQIQKEWDDNEDLKQKRPESVTIIVNAIPNEEQQEYILNEENEWKCEITDLAKYDEQGNKIIYEVTERETEFGNLEYYEDAEVTSSETQIEEVTTYSFIVKNGYKLLDTDLKAEITKQGTEEITSSNQEVEYTINFKAEIVDYIGSGKVKIVDTLPYKIDEQLSNLAEGIYDDEKQTITWIDELPHINTEQIPNVEEIETIKQSYKVDITKTIKVVYKDIDLKLEKMTNKVNGKIELYETDVKDEKETTYDTNIKVDGKVIVKYVDKETGEDIDQNYNYEIISKVGNEYTTDKKQIENYEYIESTNNEKGKITEETQEVIYYYTRPKTSVLVKYQDKEGNQLAENVLINGKVFDEYTTEQKEIENYTFVSVTDNKEGKMTKEQIVVIYVYEKTPTKVIVKYLEKDKETRNEKELLPEDVIEGVIGDEYITERKVIENYRMSEPEPDNKTGQMTKETIEVKYYYEKIPSGIITVRYIDIDTEEEITNKVDTEEKSYRYEIQGYIGDEYEAEQKEIPYYEYVKCTENVKGILTEKEDVVTYYYRKLTFNFSVEKTIKQITLKGKKLDITNNKLAKVEVRAKEIDKTDVIVSYNIKVKNDAEIKGKAVIEEIIPQGYEVIKQEAYWKPAGEKLETEVELDVGEQKELNVQLKWINNENNVGAKDNIVQVGKIQNAANFEEITIEDNSSIAGVIIGITTGPKFETLFKLELIMSIVICGLLLLNVNETIVIEVIKSSKKNS